MRKVIDDQGALVGEEQLHRVSLAEFILPGQPAAAFALGAPRWAVLRRHGDPAAAGQVARSLHPIL
jgi:hypothetical protein